MVNTRYQTNMAENADLLALLADLKKEERRKRPRRNEERPIGNEEGPRGNEESDPDTVESQVGEITYHVNSCIQKIDVQCVKIETDN
ncbi:hypothetical protein AVEN_57386-1 [Araneus ventricosus]|uniref:Uncharacterized protein n=1 Tax=Araneus ventricosus TaxID=182803 RepID=A0A4Y2CWH4_ARAVE|nr:hypothetical protein AVEN_57386-1 [Araneus ventricosus]